MSPGAAAAVAASKKRKLGGNSDVPVVKYYAVRAGNMPGVYTSWEECKANTYGYKGASYKSFPTRKDAEAFVAGKNPSDPAAPAKFYGLAVGDKPGVYTDWAECQNNMLHTKGPKFRKFATAEEAREFVRDWKSYNAKEKAAANANATATASAGATEDYEGDEDDEEIYELEDRPSAKKSKIDEKTAVGKGKNKEQLKPEKVYTDGSSLGNGKAGSSAGIGVWFGPDDPRNLSEPLPGLPQTNQRAELTAIIRALETIPTTSPVEIITDSKYSISCVTDWYKSWIKKDWKTSTGAKVMNKDLVVRARELIDERAEKGGATEFTWVKGHSGGVGNEAADRLAVAGANGRRFGR